MSEKTWARIGAYAGIVGAVGGVVGSVGGVVGGSVGTALSDIGRVTTEIGRLGTQVGGAGALATSSIERQYEILAASSPIVTALSGQRAQAQAAGGAQTAQAAGAESAPSPQGAPGKGIVDMLADLIALPFKLLGRLFAPKAGG